MARCKKHDGFEQCTLVSDHIDRGEPRHMARWYTMDDTHIQKFDEELALMTDEQRRQFIIRD